MITLLIAAATSVLIEDVPHVLQKPDFCGEACVESILKKDGSSWTQDDVFEAAKLDPALGRGAWTRELKQAVERVGYRPGPVWFEAQSGAEVRKVWTQLLADLHRGIPSIVCMHYDDSPNTTEHFRLVLGYDGKTDEVVYHEPAVENGAYRRMALEQFIDLWPLKYQRDRWTVVRLRLAKGEATYVPSQSKHRPADYAQHVLALKARSGFPAGFTIVIEPPFVVLGDERPERVKQRASGTVRWAVDRLKQDFFDEDPNKILDVWLFGDRRSYERNVKKIFGDEPGTPYGYYSPSDGALIMNIATGGGTLVHEIVHPFMEANFEDCPPWLNEGLGSLFEQSDEREGRIIGRTNWRLAGLQRTLDRGDAPSFEKLTGLDEREFYADDTGTNYAASRYLLFYLQEKGLLVRFYEDFHANRGRDPTGYQTLMKTLGMKRKDMPSFEKRWAKYVDRLRF